MTLTFQSTVAAPKEQVWRWITSVDGISTELAPIAKMTFPSHVRSLTDIDIESGKRLFRSFVLLGGIVPIDYSDLTLVSLEEGEGFLEQSPMLSMKQWQHERTLSAAPDGTVVKDILTFEPRVKLSTPIVKWFIQTLFSNRHKQLRKHL